MSQCGINCQHFLVRWSFGQQAPMSPKGIFSFTEPSSSKNIRARKQTTGTFKIGDREEHSTNRNCCKGVCVGFLLVFNDFGALTAVQLFWGLIWHWSDVSPCYDKYCRSKWCRNWPTSMLPCPKSSVDRIRRHNEGDGGAAVWKWCISQREPAGY